MTLEVHAARDPDVLTVPEAMRLLRIGRDAIYAECARNRIPHRRIGRAIRFSRAALLAWLASCGPRSAQEG
jgi:excisionase family DNA binding protein